MWQNSVAKDARIAELEAALSLAREGFQTLSVAVNDKVSDIGATNFCLKQIERVDRALNCAVLKGSDERGKDD